jgi:hypothetical protein
MVSYVFNNTMLLRILGRSNSQVTALPFLNGESGFLKNIFISYCPVDARLQHQFESGR